MAYLFSYGTLRDIEIQKAIFGRRLKGGPDELSGYRISPDKAYGSYPIVVKTDDASQKIAGKVYELTSKELEMADRYEGPEYRRIPVDLDSGKRAWLYVASR